MGELNSFLPKNGNYSNSLSFYLHKISKIPLLSREDELKFAIKAQNGDEKAKEKLIESNLRFVVAIAKKYRHQGIPLSDLINEGNIGLLIAINKFDPGLGFHFISYAVWWIRQAILKAVYEKSRLIRLPLNRANDMLQLLRKSREYEKEHGKKPDLDILAKDMNISIKLAKHLIEMSKDIISLEAPAFDDADSSNLSEFIQDESTITPEEKIENEALTDLLNDILDVLPKKERDIIEKRYGLNGNRVNSLKEIGLEYKLTKERIRQIEKKALKILRYSASTQRLLDYVNK